MCSHPPLSNSCGSVISVHLPLHDSGTWDLCYLVLRLAGCPCVPHVRTYVSPNTAQNLRWKHSSVRESCIVTSSLCKPSRTVALHTGRGPWSTCNLAKGGVLIQHSHHCEFITLAHMSHVTGCSLHAHPSHRGVGCRGPGAQCALPAAVSG